jgi:formate hydrogenlyase subunit 3/multisubunit Na+/H+ antiporter MnhD subunit
MFLSHSVIRSLPDLLDHLAHYLLSPFLIYPRTCLYKAGPFKSKRKIMLTLTLVLLVLSYVLLPITKAVVMETTRKWSKPMGIVFLVPGASLLVLSIGTVILLVGIAYNCIDTAIEEGFVENYFKKEGYDD